MSTTNYPGIDYSGPGSDVNRDSETRIRYGIINQNAVGGEAADDISSRGTDLGFENAKEELKGKLRNVLDDYYHTKEKRESAVESAFDALDDWADLIEFNGPWQLKEDDYTLMLATDGDIWVFKSPFYTYAQFCSPCAPGACHLGHPLDVKIQAGIASVAASEGAAYETFVDSNKCYCLGHDWFEDGKAPYRMWRVDNNEEVLL